MNILKIKMLVAIILPIIMVTGMFSESLPNARAQQFKQGWTVPINLSHSGSSTKPLLVIDSDSVMHVIWIDQFDGYKYVESNDGITWTLPRTIIFPFSPKDDSQPIFIANDNRTIHIFWRDKTNALYYSQVKSETFGEPGTWSPPIKLSDAVIDFKATVDSNGKLYVSYISNFSKDNKVPGVYYLSMDGLSWSTPLNLYTSQYFRSIDPDDAHIRMSASVDSDDEIIYVVWDDPAQKRIFMVKSMDGGSNWSTVDEVVSPEADLSYERPHTVEINTFNNGVMLMWQVGDSGGRCTQYSRWSVDHGNTWGETMKVFHDLSICPSTSEFVRVDRDFSIGMLNIQDNLSIIAWNGSIWSSPQIQGELTTFSNPVTIDPILLHCQQPSFHDSVLFVVGCDEGNSEDIWFTSRPLGTIENWFPPPSAWSAPTTIASVPQKISDVASVVDGSNRIHMVWVQSSISENDNYKPTIQYARSDGGTWSKPSAIITELTGLPIQITFTMGGQGRLLLAWIDQENGDLWFSWANSDRANLPLEWSPPSVLPSPSKLIHSPKILADAANNIIVTYAVFVNEHRGVYVTRSADFGKTWSSPTQVFDAIAAEWDLVDQPKIAISENGILHLIFTKYSLVNINNTPIGLYYSQSADGGSTWSELNTVINEKPILWSELISYGQELHKLWQVKDDPLVAFYDEFSIDGGRTWRNKSAISNMAAKKIGLSSVVTKNGDLHVVQLIDSGNLSIQDWEWDGSRWASSDIKPINISGYLSLLSPQASIVSSSYLGVFFALEYKDSYSLVGIERSLNFIKSTSEIPQAVIPTMQPLLQATDTPNGNLASTAISPLANLNEAPATSTKNIVGVMLIIIMVVIFGSMILRYPRKS